MTEKFLYRVLLATFVLGTLYRLYPIALGQPALSHDFITEDGYMMLTVARNIAIGLGMSVSNGTIHTNGVQPLATFLFTLPYLATGGNKVTSLVGIDLIMATIAFIGIFATRAYAARALLQRDGSPAWPWLAAALWYVGPKLLGHTMNGLETGLYILFVLLTLLQFARMLDKGEAAQTTDRLALGALCGLAFLARNDGAFLVVAIFAVWSLYELFTLRTSLARAFVRVVPPGLLSLAFATPWLIYNKLNFGSIVPISGQSESLSAKFGQNLPHLPAIVFENLFPMFPIPSGLEQKTVTVVLLSLITIALLGWYLWRIWQRGDRFRFVAIAYAGYGLLIVSYYGLFFGAPYFLSRYFAPLAPLLIAATLSALIALAGRFTPGRTAVAVGWSGCAGLLLSFALLGRLLLPSTSHLGHYQVVNWVEKNVPATTWVGAVQTGTLGYWHDRTINLDGKVNPAALQARRRVGGVLTYVVNSQIKYLVDWIGIASWAKLTTDNFDHHFELIVKDRTANLAVLRRRS